MDYLLLTLATVSSSGKALFCKVIGAAKGRAVYLANFKAFLVAALVAVLFTLGELPGIFEVSPFTLGLSVIFAGSVFMTQVTQTKAMALGPASLTTLIYSASCLVPVAFGAVFWGEAVSPVQWIGVGVMAVALFLIVWERDGNAVNKRWLLYVIPASLGSGTNAVLQKIHQFSDYRQELKFFLLFALLFSAGFSLAGYLLPQRGEKTAEQPKQKPMLRKERLWTLSPIPLGIFVGFLNFLNLMLAGRLPSVVQFPVYNIGSLILTGVISAIAFRERLSPRKLAGCAAGMAAILLIGMF